MNTRRRFMVAMLAALATRNANAAELPVVTVYYNPS